VTSQKPDQWLASKFKGTDVLGTDDKKIGSVSDILFEKSGKIEAFVVSVGGFLGVGAKEVALAPTSFTVMPGENGSADKLKISLSQDELKEASNFTPYEPPRTTTGSGGAGGSMGRSSPATPPSSR
jgi:sporulation protein YlmC with PRC-barrel domain